MHASPTRARVVFIRGTLLEGARRLHGSLTSAEFRALASFAASNTHLVRSSNNNAMHLQVQPYAP
jgi:hypothetical protein